MEILGYSERGVINSLFYEMKFSKNNLQHLSDFLSMISFPNRDIKFKLKEAKVLIEQSFSDFGDADLVLLVNNNGNKQVIFIEAKVKTFQKPEWTIENEYKQLQKGILQNKVVSSSNLFIQIYHKLRLSQTLLQCNGLNQLKNGIKFPKCSSKKYRRIGSNKVVLNAVKLLAPYCGDVLFVALVPDSNSNLDSFYKKFSKNYRLKKAQNWGYLSWETVESFCRNKNLKDTLKILKWNRGQIYDNNQGNLITSGYLASVLRTFTKILAMLGFQIPKKHYLQG